MKKMIVFLFLTLFFSISEFTAKAETESGMTQKDMNQLNDWFVSAMLIFTDDRLNPDVKPYLNYQIVSRFEDNAYVFLWGADIKTEDPYEIGLEIIKKIIQADQDYLTKQIPYDDSFIEDYESIKMPSEGLFCGGTQPECLETVLNYVDKNTSMDEKYELFMERYLQFLAFKYFDEVNIKNIASDYPNHRMLFVGQRVHHLNLLFQLKKGEDVIPALLYELELIRLKLIQAPSLVDKMIMNSLVEVNIELLSYLIQLGLIEASHPQLIEGIAKYSMGEISMKHAFHIEHLMTVRYMDEFSHNPDVELENRPWSFYLSIIMQVSPGLLVKPNLTLNSHYERFMKPMSAFFELDAKEFYQKYHATEVKSTQDTVRNYIAGQIFDIPDYKSMYLPYPAQMHNTSMKIQLLNGLIAEGSYEQVVEKAQSGDVQYLNTFDQSMPFIHDEMICYLGIHKINDWHRCMLIVEN